MPNSPKHIDEHIILKALWENSVVGIAVVAKDGTWLDANPAICRILKYTIAELRRKTFQDVTHPDDLADDQTMAAEVAAGERTGYDMEKRYITKSNRVVRCALRVSPLLDEQSRFLAFISQVSEMTDEPVKHDFPPGRKTGTLAWIRANWAQVSIIVSIAGTAGAKALEWFFRKM